MTLTYDDLQPLVERWLPSQRWYAGKGRGLGTGRVCHRGPEPQPGRMGPVPRKPAVPDDLPRWSRAFPVCSRSGRRLTSIFGGVAGGAARFGDLVEEREEIVEEVVLWARAGGVVVGVGALTVDQGEVGGRDV